MRVYKCYQEKKIGDRVIEHKSWIESNDHKLLLDPDALVQLHSAKNVQIEVEEHNKYTIVRYKQGESYGRSPEDEEDDGAVQGSD